MKKTLAVIFLLVCITSCSEARKNNWGSLLNATNTYLHSYFWSEGTNNYVRRADMKNASGSDAWGITIELDARAYMVDCGMMKPAEVKEYFMFSSSLYDRTNGNLGARILAKQGKQIYIGGDDELQWCAALMHCFSATHDNDYFIAATWSFKALGDMGFWQNGTSKGWSWNSNDKRPNGVSTAYGALAAARLYAATRNDLYKQWAAASLEALNTPQVGFFPRDMMVAASAAMILYEVTNNTTFKSRAMELEEMAAKAGLALLLHEGSGERNPTDIGDLADGLYYFYQVTHKAKYKKLAETFINFFVGHRTAADISQHGFYSRYDMKGAPILTGSYLGVPCSAAFFPEVAEMQKLLAIAFDAEKK